MEALKRVRDRIQDLLERLLDFGDRLHQQAREASDDPFYAAQHRKDAELVSEARKEIWEQSNAMTVHSLDNSVRASERANLNSTHIAEGNIKVVPWLVFTAILSGISLAAAIFVMIEFAQMQNNMARMAVHMQSNDALLLRERIIQPGDMWYGPEGNLEYGRQDQPRKK
jgi:hypothetical protein